MSDYIIEFDFDDLLMADIYDEIPLWSAPFGQLLLENIPLQPAMRVLDVGCGTGFPLLALAGRLGRSSHVVGLDVWQAALQRARKKRDYFATPHVSIVAYDGDTFPFAGNSFDMVTSNLGVNNFADPHHAMRECQRVTRSGGSLAITSNFVGHMAEFYTVFRQVLTDFGNPAYVERLNHQEAHRGTAVTHQQLVTAHGYTIEVVLERSFIMRYVSGTALFQHPVIRFGFLSGWVKVIDIPDRKPIFEQLEARLNAYAEAEGELRLTIPMLYILGRKSGV